MTTPTTQSLPIGSTLQGGKYRITRELGHGGFGITYLALQVALNRQVAIKEFFMRELCNREPGASAVTVASEGSRETIDRYRTKFVKEAQTIAGLDSPHVIRIYDIFEENGTAYYVMEYIDGGSLDDLVKSHGPLSEVAAIGYIRQLGETLQYIHSKNILHLDIKPSNVLLREGRDVVLIDFGISKHYDEAGGQTSTTPAGISHGYAPIEQYKQGGLSQFAPSTDVYSLGATFYKLLTGETPPDATDINEEGLPIAPLIERGISATTRSVILRAMSPKKKQRYQSVEEMMKALGDEPVVDDVTVVDPRPEPEPEPQPVVPEYPEPEPPKPKEPEPAPKSKLGLYVAAFVAMAVIAVAVVVIKSNDKSNDSGGSVTSEVVVPTPATGTSVPPASTSGSASSATGASESTASTSSSGGSANGASTSAIPTSSSASSATGTSTSSSSSPVKGGNINGHAYVDLGLSVKWATCNVGASSPSDYGNYYAWGETTTKSTYTDDNSKTYGNSSYNRDIGGNASLDAARANWGGTRRLPTEAEFQELIDNCTWTWTTQGGHNGYKVTSKKKGYEGRSIFLPAAGWRYGSSLNFAGEGGYYWSSSPDGSDSEFARYLNFSSSRHDTYWGRRSYGRSVRPVSD